MLPRQKKILMILEQTKYFVARYKRERKLCEQEEKHRENGNN